MTRSGVREGLGHSIGSSRSQTNQNQFGKNDRVLDECRQVVGRIDIIACVRVPVNITTFIQLRVIKIVRAYDMISLIFVFLHRSSHFFERNNTTYLLLRMARSESPVRLIINVRKEIARVDSKSNNF